MNNIKIKYIFLSLWMTMTAACHNQAAMRDKMIPKNEQEEKILARWDKGEAMTKEGTKMVKKGESLIDSGKKRITKGNQKIFEGHNIMQNCEASFLQKEIENNITELDES